MMYTELHAWFVDLPERIQHRLLESPLVVDEEVFPYFSATKMKLSIVEFPGDIDTARARPILLSVVKWFLSVQRWWTGLSESQQLKFREDPRRPVSVLEFGHPVPHPFIRSSACWSSEDSELTDSTLIDEVSDWIEAIPA